MAVLAIPLSVPGWTEEIEVPTFRTRALKVFLGLPGRPWATRATVAYEIHPKPLDSLGRALFKCQARAEGRRVLFKPLGHGHWAAWATAPLCGRATHPSVGGCAIKAATGRGLCRPCSFALGLEGN